MFELWETDEPARFISRAETLKGALDKVDALCRLRHDQELAHIGGSSEGHRFEIRDHNGKALARLTYHPDTTRPYKSVVVEEMVDDESP